ncbi:hypothetical protein RL72_01524 [Microbacterium azadirachtae]|uniref:Uncharacterized protein n=2 Tax=Microbacterium azadirachtae TaxID=582680 RepID=A0A0F0L0P9_9MICO|nr:hypothetical protein RL72_01524 [Microbacterium azadirachtae]SDL67040.1 hypothetical protein SAMN04488593_1525 [Microbacterium azadirachtae]SEF96575.1 hypothetical protein SAMN04488594_1512 [Microbacterium azadirachtae]SEF98946.1 hypothetical protein SAMN04488592_1522 [Microbacterium azadirachtae]
MWMNLLIDLRARTIVIRRAPPSSFRSARTSRTGAACAPVGIARKPVRGSILVVMPSTLSLDGLRFAMVSSTASAVDSDAPTTFDYHQDGSLIWGEYTGDTVTEGRFVGEVAGAEVRVSFAHALASDGTVVRGDAVSRAEQSDDGRIRLIEDFAVDGVDHVSVCVQV